MTQLKEAGVRRNIQVRSGLITQSPEVILAYIDHREVSNFARFDLVRMVKSKEIKKEFELLRCDSSLCL